MNDRLEIIEEALDGEDRPLAFYRWDLTDSPPVREPSRTKS